MVSDKLEKKFESLDDSTKNSLFIWGKRLLVCLTLLSICVLTVVAVGLLAILSTPVAIIIWTMIFVFLLRGIVNFFDDKGVNRVLGTAIAYVVMALVIAIVCLFMFSPAFGLAEQIQDLIKNIPVYIDIVKEWINDFYSKYGHYLNNPDVQKWINDAANSIGDISGSLASAGANGVIQFGGVVGGSFMAFGFSLVIAFWVLIELPAFGKEVSKFVKPKYKQDAEMWKISFTKIMAGYIKGTFLQCFIIGVLSGLLFWALGIGNSGALGCITGVLNIIPIFGPWIGGAVAAIGGVFISPWVAVFALIGTICIQQFVYTFISPKIMSDSCNIHPALSLMALMAGGAIGGAMSGVIGSLVGMLLSIPFVAVFKSLFIYYYEKRTGIRIVSRKGVFFKGYPKSEDKAHPFEDALSLKPKKMDKVKDTAKKKISGSNNKKSSDVNAKKNK